MNTTRRGALAAMGAAVLAPLGLTVQPRVQAIAVRPRRSKPYIDSCPDEPSEAEYIALDATSTSCYVRVYRTKDFLE